MSPRCKLANCLIPFSQLRIPVITLHPPPFCKSFAHGLPTFFFIFLPPANFVPVQLNAVKLSSWAQHFLHFENRVFFEFLFPAWRAFFSHRLVPVSQLSVSYLIVWSVTGGILQGMGSHWIILYDGQDFRDK